MKPKATVCTYGLEGFSRASGNPVFQSVEAVHAPACATTNVLARLHFAKQASGEKVRQQPLAIVT
jgi:hypothetical protein